MALDFKKVALLVVGLLITGACGGGGTASDSTAPSVVQEAAVVESADGVLTLDIPAGALPDGTGADEISVTAMGAADLPAALTGLEFGSSFYSLEPHGLKFAAPITITRRFNAADNNFDLGDGVPLFFLATSDPDGSGWEAVADQVVVVDGKDVVVSGQIEHFSMGFALGGLVSVSVPDVLTSEVGGTSVFDLQIGDSAFEGLVRGSISDVQVDADPGLAVSATKGKDKNEYEIAATCVEPGIHTYTVTVVFYQAYITSLMEEQTLLSNETAISVDPTNYTVSVSGVIHCPEAPSETTGQVSFVPGSEDVAGVLAYFGSAEMPLAESDDIFADLIGDITLEDGTPASFVEDDIDIVSVSRPPFTIPFEVVDGLGCGPVDDLFVVCSKTPVDPGDYRLTVMELAALPASGAAGFYQYTFAYQSTIDTSDDFPRAGALQGVDNWVTLGTTLDASEPFILNSFTGPSFFPEQTSAKAVISNNFVFLLQPAGSSGDAPVRAVAAAFDLDGPPALGVDTFPDAPDFTLFPGS